VVSWSTLRDLGPAGAFDSGEFAAYADILDATGRLPTPEENYEYSLPPGLPLAAVYAQRVTEALPALPRPFDGASSAVRRLLWLGLITAGVVAAGVARTRRGRAAALAAAGVAVVWASAYVVRALADERWLTKPFLTLVAEIALVALTGLVAREVWPGRPLLPAAAMLALVALPVVPRMALFFHPDPPFAALVAGATAIILRASRTGWPPMLAVGAGALLGTTALVRQSGVVAALALGAGMLLVGRRRAARFVAVVAVSVGVVAGPWWLYQTDRFGNPVEANLDRPGYMLDHQPLSFYVSAPADLITHPYRESFKNELLPKLHAELWSDWFGGLHDWPEASDADRLLASTQSTLGLGGDALVLAGLFAWGLPAARRAARGRATAGTDAPLAILSTLLLLGFAAYVLTLVRFPQADGDPIKSHYLLFIAPAAAVFGTLAGVAVWRRGGVVRAAFTVWLALYALSYAALLATSP
jgi:hypothetical protein